MSLAAQERALFDLLFDRRLREAFCQGADTALATYGLNADELADFAVIRPDALELDASMRAGLILSQFCRTFPLSFSLVSSLVGGLDLLRSLIDTETMRTPPLDRAMTFGMRLRDGVSALSFDLRGEGEKIVSILEAELGLAWTAASLKSEVLEGKYIEPSSVVVVPADWLDRPIRVAAFVHVAVIPQPYMSMKQALCSCTGAELWRRLERTPLPASERSRILRLENPRLLVARAQVGRLSPCEPGVDHVTAELSEGFASLFEHVDGSTSVGEMLAQLMQAGASGSILQGVQAGFLQLLEAGMVDVM